MRAAAGEDSLEHCLPGIGRPVHPIAPRLHRAVQNPYMGPMTGGQAAPATCSTAPRAPPGLLPCTGPCRRPLVEWTVLNTVGPRGPVPPNLALYPVSGRSGAALRTTARLHAPTLTHTAHALNLSKVPNYCMDRSQLAPPRAAGSTPHRAGSRARASPPPPPARSARQLLRPRRHVLNQLNGAGAHAHGAAQDDAGGRGGEGVHVAV